MSPSSSPSDDPFGFLVLAGPVPALTSRRAWVQALLDVEAALAAAWADRGEIAPELAAAIAGAATVDRFDVDALVDAAASGGNLVIPLVAALRAAVGEPVAAAVHRGATSQDVMDAATSIVVRASTEAVTAGLAVATRSTMASARAHGDDPMIARTLGRHAVPTAFATVTDRWLDGLAAATTSIAAVGRRPVGLGGPAGDGRSFGAHRDALVASFAERLGLPPAPAARHAQRSEVGAFAGAWGVTAAAVAKIALDVVLLGQDDVGEVAEVAAGAGGSSSMPHKQNPIAAISARAAAMQVPGHVTTLLHATGGGEWERAAGAWHAEWPATNGILRATGSAVAWLQVSLARLVVDPARMAANLTRSEEDDR